MTGAVPRKTWVYCGHHTLNNWEAPPGTTGLENAGNIQFSYWWDVAICWSFLSSMLTFTGYQTDPAWLFESNLEIITWRFQFVPANLAKSWNNTLFGTSPVSIVRITWKEWIFRLVLPASTRDSSQNIETTGSRAMDWKLYKPRVFFELSSFADLWPTLLGNWRAPRKIIAHLFLKFLTKTKPIAE